MFKSRSSAVCPVEAVMSHSRKNDSSLGNGSRGSTASSLLGRAQSMDPDAWRSLVGLYCPLVYHWCRHSGLQPNDATDVSQEVLSAVWNNIAAFQRDRPGDSFRAWLATITRNKVHDYFRQGQARLRGEGGSLAQRRFEQVPAQPMDLSTSGSHPEQIPALTRLAIELVRAGVEDRTWQAFWG